MDDYATRVLALVAESDTRPMTLKAMARHFQIADDDYPDFRSSVKRLIKEGKLDLGKDKALRPAEIATGAMVQGTFRRSSKGFGFVRPTKSAAKTDQIFIPVDAGRDASTGDEVLVKITKRSKGAGFNPEGRIVQVVARASGLFVGRYFEEGGTGFVQVDGTAFQEPLAVGDPGAKGARPGDKVAVEIARYPTPFRAGEGVITEVFGPRGEAKVETVAIIRALGIPDTFDDETLDDARQQAKGFDEEEVSDRLDLRANLTVTIDPATARDFDDAITLARDEKGYWTLGVHIADVSHFVRPNSPLDQTARKRGTSVYLPDRVIPMLPEILSNSLASLQAGHNRYTVSALLEFDPDGVRTAKSFARSMIRVDHRFAYEQVLEILEHPEGESAQALAPDLRLMLDQMRELALILRGRRFRRGGLELTMPEVEIDLGQQGEVVGAHLASTDVSHQIIEDFMLAANEAVACHLTENRAAFLRRIHADPEPKKLIEFAGFARSLGFEIDDALSRFELQRLLAAAADKPEAYAVHFGMLRSLKQAIYSPEVEGHYALASDDYCHFTSPIRRYPDLQVHRQLTALIAGRSPKGNIDELSALAEHCTKTERRAELAERELIKIKLLTYLATRIGVAFHAVIISVEDFGFFCRLVEVPAEGLVHITALSDDYYYLEGATHTLIGRRSGSRYRLGDRVEVVVVRVDIDRRELDLRVASAGSDPSERTFNPVENDLPPSRTGRRAKPAKSFKPRAKAPTRAPGGKKKRRSR